MPYSRERGPAVRVKIIDAASRLMRARGLHVSIVDVMEEAGLTHGGFYFHFKDRQDLLDKSITSALRQTNERILKWLSDASQDGLAAVVQAYLSSDHRDEVGTGCPLPAVGSNIARTPVVARRAFCRELEATIALIAQQYKDLSDDSARQQATAAVATMLGTILLARATNDPRLSDGILVAGRRAVLDATTDGSSRARPARRGTNRRRAPTKGRLS